MLLRVYNHPLWSRVTFWEDLLLAGLAEVGQTLVKTARKPSKTMKKPRKHRKRRV